MSVCLSSLYRARFKAADEGKVSSLNKLYISQEEVVDGSPACPLSYVNCCYDAKTDKLDVSKQNCKFERM